MLTAAATRKRAEELAIDRLDPSREAGFIRGRSRRTCSDDQRDELLEHVEARLRE